MSKNLKTILKSFLVLSLFTLSLGAYAAWTAPTAAPPGDNPAAPVNVSGTAQQKVGSFIAGGLRALGPSIFDETVSVHGVLTVSSSGGLKLSSGSPGDGKVLTSDADGDASWSAVSSLGVMTNPMNNSGDIIIGGFNGLPQDLDIGSNGQVLTVVSGAPAWADATGGAGSVSWGDITGTLSNQTDLQDALNAKQNLLVNSFGLRGALSDETGTGSAVFNSSPLFTGDPRATTPTAGDNDTSIATTAFVQGAVSSAGGGTIGGSGSANFLSKFTSSNAIGNSVMYQDAQGDIGINTTNPGSRLGVNGNVSIGTYYSTAGPSNGLVVSGNVGIGDSSPVSLLTVGNGDRFRVGTDGDLDRIKNVPYSWPTSNSAGVLTNNGSGTLTWAPVSTSGVTGSGSYPRIAYWTSSNTLSSITPGTNGQVLTLNTLGFPEWQNAPSGGGSGSITTSGYTMNGPRILGRYSSGTGSVQEIMIGSGLSLSSGVLSATTGGGGTVTSVGLSMPTSIFNVTSSPITSAGTFNVSFDGQSAGRVFAAPSGGFGTPTFRSLVASDIPTLPYLSNITGLINAGSNVSITGSGTFASPYTISATSSGGGLTSLNGLTSSAQAFSAQNAGTDFSIVSSGSTHFFYLPTASSSATGKLSSTDWTTFNNKIGGAGFANRVAYFTSTNNIAGINPGSSGQVLTLNASGVPTWEDASSGGGGGLPAGTVNETLRYDSTNGWESQDLLSIYPSGTTSIDDSNVYVKFGSLKLRTGTWRESSGSIRGAILKGTESFVHNYASSFSTGGYTYGNNTFTGLGSGNFTMAPRGSSSAYYADASYLTGFGVNALQDVTYGSYNSAFGYNALTNLTQGRYNVAVGSNAASSITLGYSNTVVGHNSLSSCNYSSSAGQSCSGNTAIGRQALLNVDVLSTGSIGSYNTAVGNNSLLSLTGGYNNVGIGNGVDVSSGTIYNSVVIGSNAEVSASNRIQLGDGNMTTLFFGDGNLTTGSGSVMYYNSSTGQITRSSSSSRYKTDITDLDINTNKLYDLKAVSFTRKDNGEKEFGLIAEDVAKVIPELAGYAREKDVIKGSTSDSLIPDDVKYQMLSVLILEELKKHEDTIKEQNIKIEELTNRLEELVGN